MTKRLVSFKNEIFVFTLFSRLFLAVSFVNFWVMMMMVMLNCYLKIHSVIFLLGPFSHFFAFFFSLDNSDCSVETLPSFFRVMKPKWDPLLLYLALEWTEKHLVVRLEGYCSQFAAETLETQHFLLLSQQQLVWLLL